jgi:uncharacterized protein YjbJ (UPF0337 family)
MDREHVNGQPKGTVGDAGDAKLQAEDKLDKAKGAVRSGDAKDAARDAMHAKDE